MKPMSKMHTVYNATTGRCILARVPEKVFEHWYEHHTTLRKVRLVEEVNPAFRDLYAFSDPACVHWLVGGEEA